MILLRNLIILFVVSKSVLLNCMGAEIAVKEEKSLLIAKSYANKENKTLLTGTTTIDAHNISEPTSTLSSATTDTIESKTEISKSTSNYEATFLPDTTSTSVETTTAFLSKTTTVISASPCRHFDVPSFIGGIILTLGLLAISLVAYKFYKAHNDRNYHTL